MKVLRHLVVFTFIAFGLLFSRTSREVQRVDDKNLEVKNKHYWVKIYAEDHGEQLDRKRSHKKRRKIRKPIKGLR